MDISLVLIAKIKDSNSQELVKLRGDLKVEESEDEVVKNGLGKINYQ